MKVLNFSYCLRVLNLMCLLHGLMAELSVKTNIVKVLLCDLVNNSLTPTGGENNRISILLHYVLNKKLY